MPRSVTPAAALAGLCAAVLVLGACSSKAEADKSAASSKAAAPSTSAKGASGGPTPTTVDLTKAYTSKVYADPASWLCRPDTTGDACDVNLDATLVAKDGTQTVQPFTADPDAPIDCFYVYPTISTDPGDNSDMVPGDAEKGIAGAQAARFGEVCKVYAPVYRQVPLAALFSRVRSGSITTTTAAGGAPAPFDIAYGDVADAFHQYMANDNKGRRFVLIGHSQGAGMLNQLVAKEIDKDPALRKQLLSALLIGGGVRTGEGGPSDFQHVPPCKKDTDTGCVIAYSTFDQAAPPPADSFFGKPREGTGRVLCANPAALGGGAAPLDSYFQAGHVPEAAVVSTPWIRYQGLETGECVRTGVFDYLQVTNNGAPGTAWPTDLGGRITPQWGLHLLDVNIAQGDLIDVVRTQSGQG